MFKIDVVDNIKLSLDLTIDSFEEIYTNNDDVKSYKLAIINLHSAFELTFKFMILNRNEFMIFSYSGNGFSKVLNKYKDANKCNCNSLLHYLETNPAETQPHTVSFDVAYQILAYMYNVPGFDERFIFELGALETLRNKLTHFEATIKKVDFILLNSLLEKCINLLNKEIEKYSNSMRILQKKYDKYDRYDINKMVLYSEISRKIVKDEILNEQKYKLILGIILEESTGDMVELSPDDYEEFAEICYKGRKREFQTLYSGKKEKEIKSIIVQAIYILLEAELIHRGSMYYQEIPILGRTTLTDFAIRIIREKWNDDSVICRELLIKNKMDINIIFNDIQNIEQDYYEEDYV